MDIAIDLPAFLIIAFLITFCLPMLVFILTNDVRSGRENCFPALACAGVLLFLFGMPVINRLSFAATYVVAADLQNQTTTDGTDFIYSPDFGFINLNEELGRDIPDKAYVFIIKEIPRNWIVYSVRPKYEISTLR